MGGFRRGPLLGALTLGPSRPPAPSFTEYAERELGYEPWVTKEKVRVAKALEKLPHLRELLRTGHRAWSVVREIVRVAKPHNEDEWIEATEGGTRELGDRRREPSGHPSVRRSSLNPDSASLVSTS